jgi:hypothetical protein
LAAPPVGDDGQEYPYLNVAFSQIMGETDSSTETSGGFSLSRFLSTITLELTYYRLATEQYFEVIFEPEYSEYSESHQVRKLCIQNGQVLRRLFVFPKEYRLGAIGASETTILMNAFAEFLFKASDANVDVYYPTYADSNLFELPYTSGDADTVLGYLAALLIKEGGPDLAGLTIGEV